MSNEEPIESDSATDSFGYSGTANQVNTQSVVQQIQSVQEGFQVSSVSTQQPASLPPVTSPLSQSPVIEFAQMVELEGGEGSIMYYPRQVEFDVGDVIYLRERDSGENGLIVQVIEKGTVAYPQAASKALFRLMASVRALQLQRSHHEPPETIDQFLSLQFKVRAAIISSQWVAHEGRVVTRNVDIFLISPQFLIQNVALTQPNQNV
jgi:hypothetical protein